MLRGSCFDFLAERFNFGFRKARRGVDLGRVFSEPGCHSLLSTAAYKQMLWLHISSFM